MLEMKTSTFSISPAENCLKFRILSDKIDTRHESENEANRLFQNLFKDTKQAI